MEQFGRVITILRHLFCIWYGVYGVAESVASVPFVETVYSVFYRVKLNSQLTEMLCLVFESYGECYYPTYGQLRYKVIGKFIIIVIWKL